MSTALKNATRFEKLSLRDVVGLFTSNDPATDYPDAENGSICFGSTKTFKKFSSGWRAISIVAESLDLDVSGGAVGVIDFADAEHVDLYASSSVATIQGIVQSSKYGSGKAIRVAVKPGSALIFRHNHSVGAGNIRFYTPSGADYRVSQPRILTFDIVDVGGELRAYIDDGVYNQRKTFVFKPSASISEGNVYKNFSDLYEDFNLVRGKGTRVIEFQDDDAGNGCEIPTGTYPGLFENVIFRGRNGQFNNYNARCYLNFQAGVLVNGGVKVEFENLYIQNNNVAAALCISEAASGSNRTAWASLKDCIYSGNTKPFFSLIGVNGGQLELYVEKVQLNSFFAGGDDSNGSAIFVKVIGNQNSITNNAFKSFDAVSGNSLRFNFETAFVNSNISLTHENYSQQNGDLTIEIADSGTAIHFVFNPDASSQRDNIYTSFEDLLRRIDNQYATPRDALKIIYLKVLGTVNVTFSEILTADLSKCIFIGDGIDNGVNLAAINLTGLPKKIDNCKFTYNANSTLALDTAENYPHTIELHNGHFGTKNTINAISLATGKGLRIVRGINSKLEFPEDGYLVQISGGKLIVDLHTSAYADEGLQADFVTGTTGTILTRDYRSRANTTAYAYTSFSGTKTTEDYREPYQEAILKLAEYDYFVCESSYLPTDSAKIFNTIAACIAYIKGLNTGARIGKIFVNKKADGSPWTENITLNSDVDWSNTNNADGWSGLTIEFHKETKLVGKVEVINTTLVTDNTTTFYKYNQSTKTFTRTSGAGTLSTNATTHPYIYVINELTGLSSILPVSSLTTTTAVVDKFQLITASVIGSDSGKYRIVQTKFNQRDITIKGNIQMTTADTDVFTLQVSHTHNFVHEGEIYSGNDDTYNHAGAWFIVSTGKVGWLHHFYDNGSSGAALRCEGSQIEFDKIEHVSQYAVGLAATDSTVKGKAINNIIHEGSTGSAINSFRSVIRVDQVTNCVLTDASDGFGTIYSGENSDIEVGIVNGCSAVMGGAFFTDGSGSRFKAGKIVNCKAFNGSAVYIASGNIVEINEINGCVATGEGTIALGGDKSLIKIGIAISNTATNYNGVYGDGEFNAELHIGYFNPSFKCFNFTNTLKDFPHIERWRLSNTFDSGTKIAAHSSSQLVASGSIDSLDALAVRRMPDHFVLYSMFSGVYDWYGISPRLANLGAQGLQEDKIITIENGQAETDDGELAMLIHHDHASGVTNGKFILNGQYEHEGILYLYQNDKARFRYVSTTSYGESIGWHLVSVERANRKYSGSLTGLTWTASAAPTVNDAKYDIFYGQDAVLLDCYIACATDGSNITQLIFDAPPCLPKPSSYAGNGYLGIAAEHDGDYMTGRAAAVPVYHIGKEAIQMAWTTGFANLDILRVQIRIPLRGLPTT